MLCAICLSLPNIIVRESVTILNGIAVCEIHMGWVSLPRVVNSRIRREYEMQRQEAKRKEKEIT